MKTWAFILAFLFALGLAFAQEKETTLKEYSYSELFEMIEAETDSVFVLENASIIYNPETDSLHSIPQSVFWGLDEDKARNSNRISINKRILLNNVQFKKSQSNNGDTFEGILRNIDFYNEVELKECTNAVFWNCTFWKNFDLQTNSISQQPDEIDANKMKWVFFQKSVFNGKSTFSVNLQEFSRIWLLINDCQFNYKNEALNIYGTEYGLTVVGRRIYAVEFVGNKIDGAYPFYFFSNENQASFFSSNDIPRAFCQLILTETIGSNRLSFAENNFGLPVRIFIGELNEEHFIGWNQFQDRLISGAAWSAARPTVDIQSGITLDKYLDSLRYTEDFLYKKELALRSKLRNHYREISDFENANGVYVDLKDLETRRLENLYSENPGFDTYFALKTNQFLKLFSDYGTRPAKAIIYSIYVILIFALFYVFFPNSWDTQGRKRLINRYTFFFKYLRKEAGMHEVYMENKQEELMQYEEFKNLIADSNQEVPKFFTSTALTIYKWGISGTKLSAKFLRQFDVVKGRWKDLPPSKRIWKSILITGAFIVAIIYDLFIKALNALMLSVNAFTTLGFGEIPIKGIPRYLAIIQGFIGWFMLTIFSVALISQLLN
ncbi:hypothetical protein ACT6NV_04360 [Robiginitalea sp. IMCC44478]|uniref:hypothetical protein n=1 Tax=Robiginitalea sp. IMCC44478 TaxID=3459122 RepID=UPI004041103A